MAFPDERDDLALSIPTQTAVEGLRALDGRLLCRSAAQIKILLSIDAVVRNFIARRRRDRHRATVTIMYQKKPSFLGL
jgi:hypothetical protein